MFSLLRFAELTREVVVCQKVGGFAQSSSALGHTPVVAGLGYMAARLERVVPAEWTISARFARPFVTTTHRSSSFIHFLLFLLPHFS